MPYLGEQVRQSARCQRPGKEGWRPGRSGRPDSEQVAGTLARAYPRAGPGRSAGAPSESRWGLVDGQPEDLGPLLRPSLVTGSSGASVPEVLNGTRPGATRASTRMAARRPWRSARRPQTTRMAHMPCSSSRRFALAAARSYGLNTEPSDTPSSPSAPSSAVDSVGAVGGLWRVRP
jgi:hypothetical protein